MVLDSSGDIHLLCNPSGSIQFGSIALNPTNGARVLAKCDARGNVLWAVSAGEARSGPHNFTSANALVVDRFGNTLIGDGFQNSSTFGSLVLTNPNTNVQTAFIATFDPSGNAIRAQVLLTNYSMVRALALDDLGNIYVAGVFRDVADFGITNFVNGDLINGAGFLAKYDTSGTLVWAQMLAGTSQALRVDATGGGYVTGSFGSRTAAFGDTVLTNAGFSSTDIFVARFDNTGNWVWAKRAGGSQNGFSDESGAALSLDATGNCYVAGTYYTSPFNHTGITFDSVTLNGAGSEDIFIAKYDAAGALLWVTNVVGSGTDLATGLSVDKSGNAYLSGFFSSGNLNMGNVTLTNSPGAAYNGLVAKYSTDGRLLWTKQIVGSNAQAWDIAPDQYENAYVAGTGGSTTFDNITTGSSLQLWLAKIDGPRVSISSSENQLLVSWPTNAVGLHLESATDLNLNDWSPVPDATTVVGTQNTITVNASGNSQFFRLSGP